MPTKTKLPRTLSTSAYLCAAFVIVVDVLLLTRSSFRDWPLALVLAGVAAALGLGHKRLSKLTTASVSEFPMLAAMLILEPGLAMAVAIVAAAAPVGRHGIASRALNATFIGVPIAIGAAVLQAGEAVFGLSGPAESPVLWFAIAVAAVAVDTVLHFTFLGVWNRLAHGYPLREWIRDVFIPCLKTDPMAALLLVPLVEMAILLEGTARLLPVMLAGVALYGTWLSLQTTRKQIEARDLKDDFFRAIFVSLARLLEMKDPDTAIHSARVAVFSRDIAEVMGLDEQEQGRIHLAGLLHDVGKVGVPDGILLKPGRLEDHERATMERHARLSAAALQGIPGFADLVRTVYAHHERMDGSGYPEGIEGDAVPMGARILGVADTFEALTADRPYRAGRSSLEALEVFERDIELFDPTVVEALRHVVLSGRAAESSTSRDISDFSDEWRRAARHLEVRLDEEAFILPPERPRPVTADPKFPAVVEPNVPVTLDDEFAGLPESPDDLPHVAVGDDDEAIATP